MNLPKEEWGLPVTPLILVAGALEMSASIGLGMGNKRKGALRWNRCKQWHLQCERSVMHSGKSLSRVLLVEDSARKVQPTCWKRTGIMIEHYRVGMFEAGCRRPQRHPRYEARQWDGVYGAGAVWLTLKVPLTLSPHWIPGLTQLQSTQ